MVTSATNVYAAGDCIETYDRITRRHVFFQLATTAVRQALVAGTNAAGANAKYPGSKGGTAIKMMGLDVALVHLTTTLSEKVAIHPLTAMVRGATGVPSFGRRNDLNVTL